MTEWHSYQPGAGHGLAHDPLNAIIAPRPIGWVSTISAAGARNLAPYSFFNLFHYRPPIIGFASVGWKHSVANAQATGEFVWNLATRDLADAMNKTSASAPEGADEFALAALDALPSTQVRPDRVAASPVQFECRVTQIVRLQGQNGAALDGWMVLGEAVVIHIDRAMLENGVYQTARARPISRGGGPTDYFEATPETLFHMGRPA